MIFPRQASGAGLFTPPPAAGALRVAESSRVQP
jgi:hypothetical protein